jgi:hypothetical protein
VGLRKEREFNEYGAGLVAVGFWRACSRIPSTTFVEFGNDADVNTVNRLFKNRRALRGLQVLELADKREKNAASVALESEVLAGLDDVRFFTLTAFKLDAQSFKSIAGIEDLEILILVDCEFEVGSMKPLAEADHLAWIAVPRDQVLGEKVRELRAMLPNVFVSY